MQPIAYRFSQSYIQAKTRGPIRGAIAFALILAVIALAAGTSGTWHPAIAAALVAVAAPIIFIKNRKLSHEAASHLPQVVIELSDETLCFVEPGARHELPTASITSIIVDRRSQEPRVVYLQRGKSGTVQLEGLDRFAQFIQQLSKIVGTSKIRELKWWQFPPR